jgi:hypothetical protein
MYNLRTLIQDSEIEFPFFVLQRAFLGSVNILRHQKKPKTAEFTLR